jgi:sugar lactone lactonase YvrE
MPNTISCLLAVILSTIFVAACGGGSAGPATTSLAAGVEMQPGSNASLASGSVLPDSAAAQRADATQARFRGPQGLAIAPNGDLFVADTQNFTIRKIAADGTVTTLAGAAGAAGSSDGTGLQARFTEPRAIAIDKRGNLYVADGSTIRKLTPAGTVTTLAGVQGQFGDADGTGAAARFHAPSGVAVDVAGNVFVADPFDTTRRIRMISPDGQVSTFAGGDSTLSGELPHDGIGTEAAFVGPVAVAMTANGDLIVADVAMGGLTAPNFYDGSTFIRRISRDRRVTTIAGNFGFDTSVAGGPVAAISHASALAVGAAGAIFIADRFDRANRVLRLTRFGELSTVPLDPSRFGHLAGLAPVPGGDLYASDSIANAIFRIGQDGTVVLYAGKPGEAGAADTP